MKNSNRQARSIAGISCVLTLVLVVLWLLSDPTEAPSDARPSRSRQPGPGTTIQPVEPPDPLPSAEPRSLSAVPLDGDRSEDGSVPAEPRVFGIRHASGAPASGLRVAFQRRGLTVFVGESDVDGRVTFMDINPAAGPPTSLWIGGVSGLILRVPVPDPEPDAGQDAVSWVELPAGHELHGTVTVDGALPARPVELTLVRFSSKRNSLPPDVGIRQRLARPDTRMYLHYDSANAQRVTNQGGFRFSGLADNWEGRLHFPDDLHLDPDVHPWEPSPGAAPASYPDGLEGMNVFDIKLTGARAPAPLHIALRTLPTLSGRALLPDGSPASGASVSYELVGSRLDTLFPRTHQCDPTGTDGRFAIPCTWKSFKTPTITLLAADGRSLVSLEVREAHRTNGVDLGDVFLQPAAAVTFRTLDVEGEPIAGALAVPVDGSDIKSRKTDAGGLSQIALALDSSRFTVHALEYESAEVVVPEQLPEILDVVLENCCVLRLRLAPSGARPASLLWKISANTSLFTRDENFAPEPLRLELGVPSPWMMSVQTRGAGAVAGAISYAVDESELVLSCLRPHAVFDVALTDATGKQVVWARNDLSLAPGEDRLVVAKVEARARRFEGRILDPGGLPIEGVQVYVGPAGGLVPSLGADTDGNGRFIVDDLLCDAVDFDCTKPGYLTLVQGNVPIPSTGGVELTLQPSRVMEVEVSSAEALTGATLNVLARDSPVFSAGLRQTVVGGVPTRPHRYTATVQGVAGEEATLRLVHGERAVERSSPPDETAILWDLDADG